MAYNKVDIDIPLESFLMVYLTFKKLITYYMETWVEKLRGSIVYFIGGTSCTFRDFFSIIVFN